MKKVLALVMALAMIFALAACKDKPNTDDTTKDAAVSDSTDAAAPVDGSEADTGASDESTEAPTDENGSEVAPSEGGTQAPGQQGGNQGGQQQGGNKPAADEKGLNSTDKAAVAAFYVKARKATNPVPKGQQTLTLAEPITADGGLGTAMKVVSPIVEGALKKNSPQTDWIPGHNSADIKASDVKTASAKKTADGKYTDVVLYFNEQTDGANGDSKNGGPVARGVATLGSIDGALKDLSAEFVRGKDTVSLRYVDAYVKCRIDNNTGKIVSGTWHYLVKINVADARLKISFIEADVKNLKSAVDYKVVIA